MTARARGDRTRLQERIRNYNLKVQIRIRFICRFRLKTGVLAGHSAS